MADVKAQRDWLIGKISKIGEEAPPDIQTKITLLVNRVKQLNAGGLDDFANWLDIIFDNQDRITQLHPTPRENRDKLLVITQQYEKYESSAVLRQLAINIEYELKLDMLGVAESGDPTSVAEFKYMWGVWQGQWDVQAVLNLKLARAEKLVSEYGKEDEVKAVRERWYGESIEVGRQKFRQAMAGLKTFSDDGAHPTQYHEEPVTVEIAKELVTAKAKYPKAVAAELRETALHYLDILSKIREDSGQDKFLYNQSDV
ncbi:hypothetical protein HDV00_005449 [Rhizophlyctis rosea]|nr:hypothetical protein HDV00_005449 [Rhizophlyctis rosea]